MPSTTTTRDWFLWTLSIVFLIAFISFFVQSPGLIGRKGIQPAYLVLQKEADSVEEFVLNRPTILRLLPKLGLDLDLGLDFLCIGGIVASFASFISRDHRNALVIFLQWFFYLSLVQVGQIFLASKWDNLLLEVGFVAMLLAPLGLFGLNDIKSAVVVSQDSQSKAPLKFKFLKMTQNYRLPLWYVKWTLARVVMADGATGLNNLFDGDDQDGSTLLYESDSVPFKNLYSSYENQILPTPFFWVVGCFPSCVVAIITAVHIISHFPVALFVLTPWKHTRLAAFYWLVGTSVTTALLGNQGFYPLLIISLSITLVDDDWFNSAKHLITGQRGVSYYLDSVSQSPSSPTTANGSVNQFQYEQLSNVVPANSISYLLKASALVFLIYVIALMYEVPHLAFYTEKAFIAVLQSLLAVLKILKEHCTSVTTLVGFVACCLLVSEIILAFQRQKMTMGCAYLKKMIIHIRFGILFTTTITLLTCSLVPLVWNTDNSSAETLAPHPMQSAYLWVHKHYHIVNNYATNYRHGFAGDEGRVEIVVEGSTDKQEWKEYNFLFKPSVTSSIPQIVAAHHPRLDESLWFAARSNYKQHTWILNLVYRLLNNQKEVLELFESNPFEGEEPNYIRADLYRYKFNYDLDGDAEWWTREWAGHYLPILSLADPSFVQYIANSGLLEEEDDEFSVCHANNVLASCVSFVRQSLGQTSGSVMCLLLVVLGLLLSMVDPSRATKYHVTLAPENENATQNGHLKDGGRNGVAGKGKRQKDVLNVPIEILKR